MNKLVTTRDVFKLFRDIKYEVDFQFQQTPEYDEDSMLKYPDQFFIGISISKFEKKYTVGVFEIISIDKHNILFTFSCWINHKHYEDRLTMLCQTFINSLKPFNGNIKQLITYIFRQFYLENNIPDKTIKLYWDCCDKRKNKPEINFNYD